MTRASTETQKIDANTRQSTSAPAIDEGVAVHAVYEDPKQTGTAVQALVRAGFSSLDIKVSAIAPLATPAAPLTEAVACAAGGGMIEAVGTAARMAGSMLALGSLPLLAPVLLAGPVLGAVLGVSEYSDMRREELGPEPDGGVLLSISCSDRQAAKRASKVLEVTGAQDLAIAEKQRTSEEDLKRREYRDNRGELHHHTRTYLRDHGKDSLN